MSTKIYDARRVPLAKLNAFLGIVRRGVLKRAAWQVGKVEVNEADVSAKINSYKDRWKAEGKEPPAWLAQSIWTDAALDVCEAASAKPTRDLVACIDFTLAVWIDGRFAYIIPFGERYLLEEVRFPKWAIDYSYWNSTEAPEEIGQRAWDKRGETWRRVCLDNWDATRLSYSIVDLKPGASHSSREEIRRIRIPERYAEDRAYTKSVTKRARVSVGG